MIRITCAAVTVALAIVGCNPAASPAEVAEVRELIEQTNGQLQTAYAHGDADAAAQLFTEDAILMSNEMPSIHGREDVHAFLSRFFRIATVPEYALEVGEIDVFGSMAYDRGTFVWMSVGADQDTTTDQGRYSAVRRLDPDGQWRIHRLLENSSPRATHPFLNP